MKAHYLRKWSVMLFQGVVGMLVLFITSSFSCGSTVGYWRFENGAFLEDSSGNGLTLSTSSTSPAQMALASSGSTSAFLKTIPITGNSNGYAAQLSSSYFYTADVPVLSLASFTVEAFISYGGTGTMIASQWGSGTLRSWEFNLSSNKLSLALNSDGGSSSTVTTTSSLSVVTGRDYYVGVSYGNSGEIVFYLQDLTTGTALVSQTMATTVTALFDTTAALVIGAYNSGGSGTPTGGSIFSGYLDEVRISNTVLSGNELLVSAIPELPAWALALAGIALMGGLVRRRGLQI